MTNYSSSNLRCSEDGQYVISPTFANAVMHIHIQKNHDGSLFSLRRTLGGSVLIDVHRVEGGMFPLDQGARTGTAQVDYVESFGTWSVMHVVAGQEKYEHHHATEQSALQAAVGHCIAQDVNYVQ